MKSRATQTKELDMVNGPLARKILIYSIPLMFSNLLQVFFNMTDVAVVGKFAGARALGSVGSTTIIITLTTGILLGMGGGVNAVTALHMGAEDYQSVMMIVVEPTEPSDLAPANFPTTATSVILKNT
jgi:Na+-driven multidrug efflux pump